MTMLTEDPAVNKIDIERPACRRAKLSGAKAAVHAASVGFFVQNLGP
jgi:hypothetical protein